MTAPNHLPARFNFLTVIVWLLVAAGVSFLLWQVINRISATNLPVSTPTPNQTQVNQTIAAILTAQHATAPTTPVPTRLASPTPTSTLATSLPITTQNTTPTVVVQTQTPIPTIPCDRAMAGNPIDITIPDNSLIDAGQSFIKVWKLVNAGSCTWTTAYSAHFFYGDRMDAPGSVPLKGAVPPGQAVEISVDMVAPLEAGTYQGNWKLGNPSGTLFGIGPNGDAPFWVRIIVPESPTGTATNTPIVTPTSGITGTPEPTITGTILPSPTRTASSTPGITPSATPSPTPTPPIHAIGELIVSVGSHIDLDEITINIEDDDLSYRVDADGYHWLAPEEAATIGVLCSLEPNLADCKSANMSHAPIAVESLSLGTYLCYLTNEERYGRALFAALNHDDFKLTLDLLTWASP